LSTHAYRRTRFSVLCQFFLWPSIQLFKS
jgi:hypothetical protein